jgi:hypothetical protein
VIKVVGKWTCLVDLHDVGCTEMLMAMAYPLDQSKESYPLLSVPAQQV